MQAIGKPLAGRRVLLTGASGGIGAATAQLLAAAGARLALLDRDEAALQSLAAGLPDAPAHLALALDLRDDAALDAAVHEVLARFGSVDVLINNAGVLVGGHAEQASAARVRELLDCNLYVPIRLCQLLVPAMRARGTGHVVNMVSAAALLAVPGFAIYGASKAGLYAFSRVLRRELAASGVRVTTLCPGATRSPMTRAMDAAGGAPGAEAQHDAQLPARALLQALLTPRDEVFVTRRPRGQALVLLLERICPRLLDRMWARRCDAEHYRIAACGGRGGRPD